MRSTGSRLRSGSTGSAPGIISIVAAQTTASIKEISIMRGHDPRDFDLFAYGGVGPCIPPLWPTSLASGTCWCRHGRKISRAFGLLVADVRHD